MAGSRVFSGIGTQTMTPYYRPIGGLGKATLQATPLTNLFANQSASSGSSGIPRVVLVGGAAAIAYLLYKKWKG